MNDRGQQERIRVAAKKAANYLTAENIESSLNKLNEESKKYKLNPVKMYLKIQDTYNKLNLTQHDVKDTKEFQDMFGYLYKLSRRPIEWKRKYFSLFQHIKTAKNRRSFKEALSIFYRDKKMGVKRMEASFISKMLATFNTNSSIIDSVVLKKFGLIKPIKPSKKGMPELSKEDFLKWFEATLKVYEDLEKAYKILQKNSQSIAAIKQFDERFKNKITRIKKLDFILWQIRPKDLSKGSNK